METPKIEGDQIEVTEAIPLTELPNLPEVAATWATTAEQRRACDAEIMQHEAALAVLRPQRDALTRAEATAWNALVQVRQGAM